MQLDRQGYLARMEVQVDDLHGRVAALLGREPGCDSGALARVRVDLQQKLQKLDDAFGRARSAEDGDWVTARELLSACCAATRIDVGQLEDRARERVLNGCRREPA